MESQNQKCVEARQVADQFIAQMIHMRCTESSLIADVERMQATVADSTSDPIVFWGVWVKWSFE